MYFHCLNLSDDRRYFKQHTGKTISQYLLEVSIDKAANMLRTTLIPISDIAMY